MRLVQLHRGIQRRLAVVEEPALRPLAGYSTLLELATAALEAQASLVELAERSLGEERLDYDAVYTGASDWRLLPPVDHPEASARLLVSGTGLTHQASAENRQAMHAAGAALTDSMRMYQWGEQGGRPAPGQVGVAPEWFYKGSGAILRAHLNALVVPAFAEDGGEEPEIAGIYLIDPAGVPRRIGMATGNEFSNHAFERHNYLNLAGSKLRNCALGPEIVLTPDFSDVSGRVAIYRDGAVLWEKPIRTGEVAMCHSLANLEHHHFKFDQHRCPGDLHVHFYGASAFSFGAGVALRAGDWMEVGWSGFGRALRNPLLMEAGPCRLVTIQEFA
jgi:hypothetical protein